jgi:nucleotide-binding universal stress UspA family protein
MPVIIAATDFSPVATNAVHYACRLANACNAAVHIVHSFIVPVTFSEAPMPMMTIDEGRQIAEDSMTELHQQLSSTYPGQDIQTFVTYGDITDSLQEYAEKVQPIMIVVGNSSDEGTSFWLGSNLISELKELPCTVMAIPSNAVYQPAKKICLACDFKQVTDTFPANDLISLVKATGAELHVLNVDHKNREFGADTPLNTERIHEFLHSVDPQYHFIDNGDIEAGINSFVGLNNMDWLAVIPHKHSFVEAMFRKSHTKAIVRMSHIPLVALHERIA